MSKMATMAKMASATHVVLMATSVVADILMLYGDDGVDVVGNPEHAVGPSPSTAHLWMLDRRTHYHPVSATINNPKLSSAQGGPNGIVLPCVAAAEQDSASDG